MEIEIDDRERDDRVATALGRYASVRVVRTRLKAGDFRINGQCVYERKTLADFACSLADGRLFSQAGRLSRISPGCALILEGPEDAWPDTGPTRESILGALVSLTLFSGLPLLRTRDPEETARVLVFSADQLLRWAAGSFQRPGHPARGRRRQQLFVLQGLPGIGPRRAERLLERFGSLGDVFAAGIPALAEVEGIGPGTAEAIHRLIHHRGTGTVRA